MSKSEIAVAGTVSAGAIRHSDGVIEKRVMMKLPGMGEYVMTPNFARIVADALTKGAEKADAIQPHELDYDLSNASVSYGAERH